MTWEEGDVKREITVSDIMGTTLIGEQLAKALELSERHRLKITRRKDTRSRDRYVNI